LHESGVYLVVRFLNHGAEGALEELRLCVGPPGLSHRAVAAAHRGLEVLALDLGGEIGGERDLHVSVYETDVRKSKLQAQVMVVLDHVLDRQEDRAQGVFDDVLAHLAGGGDGHRVGVDHAEALLEDRPLGLGRRDLLLAVIPDSKSL
jgi:hypothetical protein